MNKKKRHLPIVAFLFLGYAVLILFGSLLLSLPAAQKGDAPYSYVDCLFTSVSATCVTGLVPFDTALSWSLFGQITIISLIQIGGLGFMTVITLIYLFFGKRLGLHDQNILFSAQGGFGIGDAVPLIKRVFVMTFSFELIGALLLMWRFVPLFGKKGIYFAIFTSISAFCNAGFDVFGTGSLSAFINDPAVLYIISAIIVSGGIGFLVWWDIIKKRLHFKKYTLYSKLVLLSNAALILGGAVIFYICEFTDAGTAGAFADMPLKSKIANAVFCAVTPRTAGFMSVDMTRFGGASQFLCVVLMFIGGNSCSTAGGVKVSTFVVLLSNLVASSRGAKEAKLLGRKVPTATVELSSAIFLSYLLLSSIAVILIGFFEPLAFDKTVFECISAIATVGLTLNVTPSLCAASKIVLILLMYIGRLGAFAFFELIFSKRQKEYISLPEGKIMVG